MGSVSGGIILVVAFAIAFAISRLIVKRRNANTAAQEQLRAEQLKRSMPPATPSKNKSKRRREEKMRR